MAKRVILAVAGSGKTYSICQNLPRDEKTLILAFTHANIHNIVCELTKANEGRPLSEKICVMTFDSFVYRYAVAPYLKTIATFFGRDYTSIGGITQKKPPVKRQYTPSGYKIIPKYKQENILHYVDEDGKFYLDNLCELVVHIKRGRKALIKDVAAASNMFWKHLLVDEFQDFRRYDSDFLIGLCKLRDDVLLVGDYYQHSVSATANSGKPFKNVSYEKFVQWLQELRFDVDVNSLNASRRCSKDVCEFVEHKLGIKMSSCSPSRGCVTWLEKDDQVDAAMNDDGIMKLVFENSRKMPFRANNWSYSKGDTYKNACVILTGTTDDLRLNYPASKPKSDIITNKLYVALTRSSGDLYLVSSTAFSNWCKRHGVLIG